MNLPAILHKDMPDLSALAYDELDEEFVDIAEYSSGKIEVEMKYYLSGREGAINIAYLRRSVADRLLVASRLLPEGYRLRVYDAWRPYEVQRSLFDEYVDSLARLPENAGKSRGELCQMARTFVSMPDRDKKFAYVHSSGGAVDLTVVDEEGRELDMGCGFDDFTDMAYTDAFEDSTNYIQRDNRRLLYHVMSEVGFTNYPSEWWHYDFGDLFWAAMTGNAVRFASVYSTDELTIKQKAFS